MPKNLIGSEDREGEREGTACSRCSGAQRVYTRHVREGSYSYKPCPKCSGGECEGAFTHRMYPGQVCRFCEVQLPALEEEEHRRLG